MRIFACASLVLLASACTTLGDLPNAVVGKADLKLSNGAPAGRVIVTASDEQVTLSLAALGMAPGTHGTHLHMVGSCVAPAFTSAGSHLNPSGHQHGTDNPNGSHLGDLPNIVISPDGTGTLSALLRGTRSNVEAALFDADGTAIVIHADADDYKTDPTGNSGGRIACGVLSKS